MKLFYVLQEEVFGPTLLHAIKDTLPAAIAIATEWAESCANTEPTFSVYETELNAEIDPSLARPLFTTDFMNTPNDIRE